MNNIELLKQELLIARDFEVIRIDGYNEILSFPSNILSDETRAEVQEALTWSSNRVSLIARCLVSIDLLMAHNYPVRVQQMASSESVNELIIKLENMRVSVSEFEKAPEGELIVGEEVSI